MGPERDCRAEAEACCATSSSEWNSVEPERRDLLSWRLGRCERFIVVMERAAAASSVQRLGTATAVPARAFSGRLFQFQCLR